MCEFHFFERIYVCIAIIWNSNKFKFHLLKKFMCEFYLLERIYVCIAIILNSDFVEHPTKFRTDKFSNILQNFKLTQPNWAVLF
jgi:hypothetical protein